MDHALNAAERATERADERLLSGPLALEVARFGAPLALGMGLQTAFNLVDAYLIGHLDAGVAGAALGAVGICDQLAALGTIVSYGLTTATAAMVSRRHGEGDKAGVERAAWQSLYLVLGLSLVFALGGLLGAGALVRGAIGAKGMVATLGTRYLRVMMAGSFSIFLLLHLTSLARALGSSKTPVLVLVAANALNFLLAVLMVYGPGQAPAIFGWGPPLARLLHVPRLGLMGAAWATLLARFVALGPALWLLVGRFSLLRPSAHARFDRALARDIVKLGWPSSAQLVARIAAMLLVQTLVARAFTTDTDQSATTALGIVFRLETMAFFVGLGWGSAAQTFIGVNLGAKHAERAKRSGYFAALYNAVMMGTLALVYVVFGSTIVAWFDADRHVVDLSLTYFRWVGPSYLGLGVGIVLGSAMQGAGATKLAFYLDAAVILLLQVPASLVVGFAHGASFEHLCMVVAATYVAFAVVYVLGYRGGRFLKARPV
ncbi:MAG TPA: MATE family efflux transporter [Polyangiaceae bacterium]|nr:MATE family efflux transporter [Polyangiaceae bacterium]